MNKKIKQIGKFLLLFILISSFCSAVTKNRREIDWGSTPNNKVTLASIKNGDFYRNASSNYAIAESVRNVDIAINNAKDLENLEAELISAVESGDTISEIAIKSSIDKNAAKIAGILSSEYDLTTLFQRAEKPLSNIASSLVKIADYLLLLLTVLEIIMMFVNEPTKFPLDGLAERIVRYFILKFIIYKWTDLTNILKGVAVKIANAASGGAGMRFAPQEVWEVFSHSITSSYSSVSFWNFPKAIVWSIILLPALILCAFIVADLFMALLEYKVLTGFSILLLPFMAWKNTRGIGEKIFTVFSSQIVRLILMYFFLAVAKMIIPPPSPISFYDLGSRGMGLYFKYAIVLWVVRILIGKTSALASALMSGGTATTGRDATSPASSLIGGATGTILGVGATILGYKAIKNNHSVGKLGAGVGSKMANAAKKMFKNDDNNS